MELPYVSNFLTPAEANALFAFCQTLPHERLKNPRNRYFYRRVKYPAYTSPFLDAPTEIYVLANKLAEYAGKPMYHLGVGGYENANDGMNFHQHKKDQQIIADQTVYVVSLGEEREIGIRRLGERGNGQTFYPAHGSLYVLPHSYNITHEHAVLKSKTPCGLRIRIDALPERRPWMRHKP